MLDEYLALGGVELGNNARAYDYALCMPCCAGLLKLPGCEGIHDATNPWAPAQFEWLDQETNLATNPSFETASGTVEVRRNYVINPSFEVNVLNWANGGVGAFTRIVGDAATGAAYLSIASTHATIRRVEANGSGSIVSAVAGKTFTIGAYVRGVGDTVGLPVTLRLTSTTTANVGVTTASWQWFHATFTLTSTVDIRPDVMVADTPLGSVTHVDGVILSETPGPYFDGTTPAAGDFTHAWTSTANASASIQYGVQALGATADTGTAKVIQSSEWASSGAKSLRVIPTAAGSYAEIPVAVVAGKTYTVMTKMRLSAPLTGTLSATSRTIGTRYYGASVTGEYGAQAPNTAGVHEHRWTFTVPADATNVGIRPINGASVGNGDVWWDDLLIVEGEYDGPYFDGDTLPAGADPVNSQVRWTGDPHASASILSGNELIQAATSEEPPYDCATISRAPWYDEDSEVSSRFAGFYLLSVQGATDGTMTAGTTEGIEDGGVIGASHHAMRSVRVRSMLVGCGNDAAEYGLAWLKAALGEKFCGRHGGACGTSDLAFFIDCPPPLHPESQDYDIHVDPYRRYLHGVACTSAPIISAEYETPSGAYVIIVDYILTAESPFVWGESERVGSGSTVLTAYDDIPFNLMRYPSAETADGVPRVVATNYAMNGSVEYGTTGWVAAVLTTPAGIAAAGAQSTDIAAVGPHSFRGTYTATATLADVFPYLRYDVSLAGMPAGARPSVSVWGRVNPSAGSPVIDRFRLRVEFWDAAQLSVIEVADFDPGQYDGQNLLATGLEVPAGATQARILLIATTDVVNGDALRIYGDAFALTVP